MSINNSIRILIADAHPITRTGICAALARDPSLYVVGEVGDGAEAVAQCRLLQPHIALMEARLPSVDGIEAARIVCRECPSVHVIIFAHSSAEEDIYQAFEAGAKAYLLKDSPTNLLVDTICAVQIGQTIVPPAITAQLVQRAQSGRLTGRELEVLTVLVTGKSNAEIGQALFIAEGTVKAHINSILEKMGVQDRTQAAVNAVRRGIVRLP